MKKPELLAPAGDLERLKIAVLYGADAVFLGGENYGLRSGANNFDLSTLKEGVSFAKSHGVKIYVATNIFPHKEDYEGFKEFVKSLEQIGVKGIIVSDPGYIKIAHENTDLEIHISTQQSIMNHKSANFFKRLGASRVVLGRELSESEIKSIVQKTSLEVEVFIHGAVCSSYSGRCTLSNHMTLRDSNRGGCCQSCRWNYSLIQDEETVAGENESKFNMSAKDMNLLEDIPKLMNLGVDSFKIEGRMKSIHYVATVIKVYRQAIDSYVQDPENYELKKEWIEELKTAESRQSSSAYFNEIYDENAQIYDNQYQEKSYDYCGYVLEYNKKEKMAIIQQRNYFKIGDTLEVTGPDILPFEYKVNEIRDIDDNKIEKANHPLMLIKLNIDIPIKKHYILRKAN